MAFRRMQQAKRDLAELAGPISLFRPPYGSQNYATYCLARLLNLARKRGEGFQITLRNYLFERSLYRLGRSELPRRDPRATPRFIRWRSRRRAVDFLMGLLGRMAVHRCGRARNRQCHREVRAEFPLQCSRVFEKSGS